MDNDYVAIRQFLLVTDADFCRSVLQGHGI